MLITSQPRRLCIYQILYVCLSVYLQNISKSYEQILMKFCGEVDRAQKNRLDFVGNPVSFVDPGSFSRILYH